MTNINVNAEQCNSLSLNEQQQIINILKKTTLLKEKDSIVLEAGAPSAEVVSVISTESIFCEIACRTGQAAAIAACASIPGGQIAFLNLAYFFFSIFIQRGFQKYRAFALPTLVITRDSDVAILPGNSNVLVQKISGAKLAMIKDAAHGFAYSHAVEAADPLMKFLL
ncbi:MULTISPECIES: alpha/beta fold hydrolase [Nostoc]|uniref:Uncharacterized protein n=2 Tax=Nostoc TaxID=1177 RepID=A0ABR8IMR9_9NOSO|nr:MULTISPECIES: hypothetical protein [Nostoc]MBD2566031.1 hypothetical protein [Nostoc linckia FACHB-391]MBD2651825.1 hypothetical protein [Nostoc foliaceum FACHB-393]